MSRAYWPNLKFDTISLNLFLVAVVTLLIPDIGTLIGRIKKLKKGDFEIELDSLTNSVSAAASEIPAQITKTVESTESELFDNILSKTASSPKIGLIKLSEEIEKKIRMLLAPLGFISEIKNKNIMVSVKVLKNRNIITSALYDSLEKFWKLKYQSVHGNIENDKDIIRTIDSGITILKALDSVFYRGYEIYKTNVNLFSDKDGNSMLEDVKGLILFTTATDMGSKSISIVPVTKTDYIAGKKVTWEWNLKRIFGETWFKDSESGQLAKAWHSSSEFVGKHLDEI